MPLGNDVVVMLGGDVSAISEYASASLLATEYATIVPSANPAPVIVALYVALVGETILNSRLVLPVQIAPSTLHNTPWLVASFATVAVKDKHCPRSMGVGPEGFKEIEI